MSSSFAHRFTRGIHSCHHRSPCSECTTHCQLVARIHIWIEVKIFVVCSFPGGFEEQQCVSVTLEEEAETDWERPDITEY
jgi:hypothetical protein